MADLIAPLRAHPPFDELEPAALEFLAKHLQLAYYPRGTLITGPESGAAARLYIVKQGSVRGSGGAADVVLGPGECFPLGALAARRATSNAYKADTDVFCWELPEARYRELVERSARFRAFSEQSLVRLLERSQRALRSEVAESSLDGAGMLAPVKSVLRRSPVTCAERATLGEAIARMHAERVGSIVVLDAQGGAAGIFTTVDLLEAAATRASHDAPVSAHMTARPFTLEEEAMLADAALAMARHGFRHIVVTRDGKVTGVVSERDLFALQRLGVRRTGERIRAAARLEQLVEAAHDIRRLARHLLAQGVSAGALTEMTSALNDALTRRVIELAQAKRALPGAWCWLALGSEGRMEQTLVTDQDNALIVEGASQADKAAFLAFADRVNRDLDACGFPLCKGDVMARNPRWCLTPAEWRQVFDGWIRNNDGQALLNASIFFDFRALAGEARLAGALREHVLPQTKADRAFCRALAEVALQTRPPLGLVSDFSAAELDLKALGARPFVDAARVLALAAGRPETGTVARLRAAGENAAPDAFHFIQTLRLRHERNRIHRDELNDIDRRVLKEAFRQALLLQERVRLDFAL
jgi:CBS domain-containing protein